MPGDDVESKMEVVWLSIPHSDAFGCFLRKLVPQMNVGSSLHQTSYTGLWSDFRLAVIDCK
jgi:hypothetical protein